jgi:hypothetical protein
MKVGWVERSETHQTLQVEAMGFAELNPSYCPFAVEQSGVS